MMMTLAGIAIVLSCLATACLVLVLAYHNQRIGELKQDHETALTALTGSFDKVMAGYDDRFAKLAHEIASLNRQNSGLAHENLSLLDQASQTRVPNTPIDLNRHDLTGPNR